MPGPEVNARELAWAAGLFEGEGCLPRNQGGIHAPHYPVALLGMTDEDSVRRFQRAVGLGTINRESATDRRPLYRWKVAGFEKTQAVIAMLWFGLGERRRERATEMLTSYVAGRQMGQINAAKTHCPQGHPYDEENTYVYAGKYRQCRACHKVREVRRRELSRAKR